MLTILIATAFANTPAPTQAPAAAPTAEAPAPAISSLLAEFDDVLKTNSTESNWLVDALSPQRVAQYAFGSSVRDGDDYPGFTVREMTFADADAATAAAARMFQEADPDVGLTYAWDYAVADGDAVIWLSAPCRYGASRFEALRGRVETTAPSGGMVCKCGFGCKIQE